MNENSSHFPIIPHTNTKHKTPHNFGIESPIKNLKDHYNQLENRYSMLYLSKMRWFMHAWSHICKKCKNIFTKMLKDVGIEVPKSIETRSKCSMHADKGRG